MAVHERAVTLRLGDAVARGRVRVPGGYEACAARVRVTILRNGRVVRKTETGPAGRFRADLPDKPGRYRAVASQTYADDTNLCAAARSRLRRI